MIDITKLYSLIQVWLTLTFIQGHGCMKMQKLPAHFLASIAIDFYEME